MKKRTLIPAVIAMGFFAGCDFSSWCDCTKKAKEPVAKEAVAETHAAPEEMHPTAHAKVASPTAPEIAHPMPAAAAPEAALPAMPSPAPMPEEPEDLAMPEEEEPAAMPAPKAPAPKAATSEEENFEIILFFVFHAV